MKPMVITSTRFLSYRDIKVNDVDLFEDAWSFNSEFSDVIEFLRQTKASPGRKVTKRLIDKIRKSA
jgi:hypothetical protein